MHSKTSFKFSNPRTWGGAFEGLKFLAGVALTCWVPPLMYCSITGESTPFYAMIIDEAVGAALGLLMYNMRGGYDISCVPADVRPAEARQEHGVETKKAA